MVKWQKMAKKRVKKKSSKTNRAFEKFQKKLQSIKTENGKLICKLMRNMGVKGNYKDYVLVTPTEIIDWQDKWLVVSGDTFDRPQLMHKKLLRHILGEDVAAQIWHPTIGRLVSVKRGTKKMEVERESR